MKIFKNELDVNTLETSESLLFNGNGFIGVRNCFFENDYDHFESTRETYINGFYEETPIKYPEKFKGFTEVNQTMVPVIDGQRVDVYIGSEKFDILNCEILDHKRYVNMKKGICIRKIHFKNSVGHETIITETRIVSFEFKEQFLTKMEFEKINHNLPININMELNFESSKKINYEDPRVGHDVNKIEIDKINLENKEIKFSTNCLNGYFMWGTNLIDEKSKKEKNKINVYGKVDKVFIKSLSYSLDQFVKPNVEFDKMLEKQIDFLNKYWEKSFVSIKSKDNLEQVINYNSYCLLQSTGTDGRSSISAKGLSGNGYEGHVFWDAEMFIAPFFIKTNKEYAKSMIKYRINQRHLALENRKLVGYKEGILFPWRTISGKESSPFFEAGMAQHHINLDIAYCLIEYIKFHEDYSLLQEGGIDLLIEVCRLFANLVYKRDDKYHLDMITGPDEYNVLVDDNFYTNIMLKYVLENTVNFISNEMDHEEINKFLDIAENIELLFDENKQILKQDKNILDRQLWPYKENKHPLLLYYHPLEIYRYQVCKQADVVLAVQLFFNDFLKYYGQNILENTIEYYDNITTHDSSLSFSTYACVYAKLKNMKKAYEYFKKNVFLDLENIHQNTKNGIHTAAMGGTYQVLIDGFANLSYDENGLKVLGGLPPQIDELIFKVGFRGQLYKISMNKTNNNIELIK